MLIATAGCNRSAQVEAMAAPADVALAQGYIDLLRERRFEQIEKDLSPELRSVDIRSKLARMAEAVPAQPPLSRSVVGYQVMRQVAKGAESTSTNVTFEYRYAANYVLANVATLRKAGTVAVTGISAYPRPDSLEHQNAFTFAGKGPLHYAVLTLALLEPAFILYALATCIRTRMARRKWLWILFIVAGFFRFSLNWTTGAWSIEPLGFQLLGAGVVAMGVGPWVLSVSVPVGAIAFLIRRRTQGSAPQSTAGPVPDGDATSASESGNRQDDVSNESPNPSKQT
jgi:hypothetical protein